MATRYKVKAKRIVVRVPGAQGGETYMREGRQLPSSVEPAEIDRLLELDLIEEDAAAGTLPPPAAAGEGEQVFSRADVDAELQARESELRSQLEGARAHIAAEATSVADDRAKVDADAAALADAQAQLERDRARLAEDRAALEAASQPAKVELADGSEAPKGQNGVPVLTDTPAKQKRAIARSN